MIAQSDVMTRDQAPIDETWDLSRIYPADAAWDVEYQASRPAIEHAARHRGALGESAERLKQALDDIGELRLLIERLYVYARLRSDEDTGNSQGQARMDRAVSRSIEASEALAFVDPEILALPDVTLDSLISDPELAIYRRVLEELRRNRPHTRSLEVEELLAQAAELARAPQEAFNVLDNADIDFGTILDEHERPVHLTKGRYELLMERRDRGVRARAFEALTETYRGHRNTLAAIHAGSVRNDVFFAKARGFESSRAAALFGNNIPETVYDSLIAAVRGARPSIERYLDLRRRILGLDDLQMFDLYVPLAPQIERHIDYRDGEQIVLRGLGQLGTAYVDDLRNGFGQRWVDVNETKGKRSGAYSWGVYGTHPVILMNWNGSLDHVFTLAHEAGHAMHSYYADAAQPYHEAHYSIFLAEIASTINEVLLTWKLLEETPADDPRGRFELLNRFADTIHGTLIRQAMFAEFEHRTHRSVETGEPLTVESLDDLYGEMIEAYIPSLTITDAAKANWNRVPHFYSAFYVYQYATGISAAIAMARQIRDEGEPAAERFLEMLRAGGSDYPLAVLQRAGVDLTTPEPVNAALAEFDAMVAEMTTLYDQGALAE